MSVVLANSSLRLAAAGPRMSAFSMCLRGMASSRSKRGLYGGRDVRFGNMVSHSERKTRRRWNPNVINKRVWSDSLNDWVRFKMTTHVLREIDKVGGIDEYLARLPEGSIEDPKIMDTRNRVLLAMREQQDSLQQS